MTETTNKLSSAVEMLKAVFPPDKQPSLRWLREQMQRRTIPFIKIGRLVYFDVEAVREAIRTRHTVNRKQ